MALTSEKAEIGENVAAEEEDESCSIQDLYLLTEHGAKPEDLKQMKSAGICTIKGVQMTACRKLIELTGLTEQKINSVKQAASKMLDEDCFITGLDLSEERKSIFRIPTGCSNLNNLLGGGVESMSVTEVFGEARSGKTQIAHTLAVCAQIPHPDSGYPGGKVLYIDTEHTFRPERIRKISNRFELDATSVLSNILYSRAFNSEHLLGIVRRVAEKFHQEAGIFKLLIVDSIMALFRSEFGGLGQIGIRQQLLLDMMSRLQKISEEFNVAVFITNQITADFKFPLLEGLDVPKPAGGNVLAHASTTRIALKILPRNTRIAVMFGSPDLEEGEEVFVITGGGIADPEA